MIAVTAVLGVGFICVVRWLLTSDPPPHAGIYPQPGRWYWLKRAALAIMYHLRVRSKLWAASPTDSVCFYPRQSGRVGTIMHSHDMEHCQKLSDHPFAVDSVYFGAFSEGKGPNISIRIARRPDRQAEVWLVLQVPGVGCLQHPIHPDTTLTNVDPNSFTAGGLHVHVVHPMKTWRISFSGQLRVGPCDSTEDKPEAYLDSRFSFQWEAFAPHFNYDSDLHPSLLGDAIARETWSRDNFQKFQTKQETRYEQWGEIKGSLCIEGQETQHLRLKTIRAHSFGVRTWTDYHRYIACFLHIENGTTLQIGVLSLPGIVSHLKTGCLTYPNGEVGNVTAVNLNLWEVGENPAQPPALWSFTFVADGVQYKVNVTTKSSSVLYHEEDRGGIIHQAFCDITMNGRKGCGSSEFFYRNTSKSKVDLEPTLLLLAEPSLEQIVSSRQELYLPFTSPSCCSSALVGGKGAQLALLTKMSEMEDISVPPGLCLTLRAFEKQMEEHSDLQRALTKVADTAVNNPQQLIEACSQTASLVGERDVCSAVQASIREGLQQLFGHTLETKTVAVRSSAAGEDGVEASSAGQMDTFLGVKGQEEIFKAVQKCWASAFTYQAVEYRRQHGQPVLTLVGVVIQEMVPADVAGVLFTADPVTQNANVIVINSNFGLGESVVSGKCEPDTISVRRGWDKKLTITQRHAGHKQTKVMMQDEGGITEVNLSTDDGSKFSMTDEEILALSRVGVQTEKYFGTPRDIEWAYAGGEIYLLQARPITSTEQESEEELIHEFDSPLAGGYEWLTTGNIGEMMPGAVTPLTLSIFSQAINVALQLSNLNTGARLQLVPYPKTITTCGNHLFISLIDLSMLMLRVAMTNKDIMELNLLGESCPHLSVDQTRYYCGRPLPGKLTRVLNMLYMHKNIHKSAGMTEVWEKRLENYVLEEGCDTAAEVYAQLDSHMHDLFDVWHWTAVNSSRSGVWTMVLCSTIIQNPADWTADLYGDIAMLLSQCQDVYSAEVPTAMQEIAKQIVQDGLKDSFLSSSVEECLKLLGSDKYPKLQQKMQNFFQRHGHRCVRESEMREKSWQVEPSKVISVLKALVQTGMHQQEAKKIKTAQHLVSQLQTPLPFLSRKILQYLLPRAWSSVASREWGKSISIKMNNIFKLGYCKLAALMVKEGRLPDEDLIFFLTHYEIGVLLATRSARLVMKALRRRKVLPKQMALRFPKINMGHPQPINETEQEADCGEEDAVTTLNGMPVSHGVVTGPARVVLSLSDAHTIQAGDVLVVNITDVGWSPYFPLIAGLVTEIGGLISHGAVVAREYGIPCVVNVPNATVKITSGTNVELNGRAGTIKILS